MSKETASFTEDQIIDLVAQGKLSIVDFKKHIEGKPELIQKYQCSPLLEGLHTKFDIVTDNGEVLLKEPVFTIEGQSVQVQIGWVDHKHKIFRNLDTDSEYTITLPAPGISLEDLISNYKGPVHIMHVMQESDYSV